MCSGSGVDTPPRTFYSLELSRVHTDTGTHGSADGNVLQILTLSGRRLSLDDRIHDGLEVLFELLLTKGNLTDRAVDDVCLIETVLDLTGFDVCNSLATSMVTVPAFGVGIKPFGPRTLPRRPSLGIMSGVAMRASKSNQFPFAILSMNSSAPTYSAPAA